MPDANVSKLRWLLTEAAKNCGLTLILNANVINRLCAEQDRLMRDNGMGLMVWQSQVDKEAAKMDSTTA